MQLDAISAGLVQTRMKNGALRGRVANRADVLGILESDSVSIFLRGKVHFQGMELYSSIYIAVCIFLDMWTEGFNCKLVTETHEHTELSTHLVNGLLLTKTESV